MKKYATTPTGRVSFSKVKHHLDYPDFLDVQLKSFREFFQLDAPSHQRKEQGLYQVFSNTFPITDSKNTYVLEFLDYFVEPPAYTPEECRLRGQTYGVSLKARLKLYCTDEEHEDFETQVQDVFLGRIPYMTPWGTFIINGTERVIVSQIHRSPGVYFKYSFHAKGARIYSARVAPFKGTWIEFSTDINNVMFAYIDRKKKVPVTTLLRAIGYETDEDILNIFGIAERVRATRANLRKVLGRKLAAPVLGRWIEDFVDEDTGEVNSIERVEVILDRNVVLEEEHIPKILDAGVDAVVLYKDESAVAEYELILNTLEKDPSTSKRTALEHIYRVLRNADPPDDDTLFTILDRLFFSQQKYDLGEVGRYKLNKKLGLSIPLDVRVLTKEDITTIIKKLIELANAKAQVDDIDHLSNRRVRTVGEQLYNQFTTGLSRMARTIRERMNVRDNEVFAPIDLINSRTLSSVLNSFFGSHQLSQFLDHTNPLAAMTHKRRLSALGPGGLTREHAGFEVRDVHYTHYGRLCPIETPEGPNIGLISSLAVYAKVNSMGFLETPYRKVEKGRVLLNRPIVYLAADEEEDAIIAQATEPIDDQGRFINQKIRARKNGELVVVGPEDIDYIDVASNQIVSIAASLIPFLEHDDANRALMGSNMQRQAVPLVKPESPIVGTGIEARVVRDSRQFYEAEGDGTVVYVDANKVVVRYDRSPEEELVSFHPAEKEYEVKKFERTNQDTCINLRPIVRKGQRVKKGDILVEGYSTEKGELALGKNLLVAFMPWQGYNFEDAIVLSERLVKDDELSSIHIHEFDLDARSTKSGDEEFTSDFHNLSDKEVAHLEESGLARIGTEVKERDILIGKVTPKGDVEPLPEDKLLRAIFGTKARPVKDASLRMPPGSKGVVIKTVLLQRSRKAKGEHTPEIKAALKKVAKEYEQRKKKLRENLIERLVTLLKDKTSVAIKDVYGNEIVPRRRKFTRRLLEQINYQEVESYEWTTDEAVNDLLERLFRNYFLEVNRLSAMQKREEYSLTIGNELPMGVLQFAKIYVAEFRKIKVGDKMAGRHGNKGVVARIVPEEDMPYLEDGTPVDIVLNPLGVPSRMNIGQIYETILGWAGKKLGVKFATPIFDGALESEVREWMEKAGLPASGKTYLYDGRTGERFDQPTTVGYIYMLKLGHLVDDKVHARSIGPYSLITQQPLGGKSQFGGQRFGEMEVWALEAYGASKLLREMLTIKSDDVSGRRAAYDAITKGKNIPEPGLPESFRVLTTELRGLGVDVRFLDDDAEEVKD